MKIKIPRKNLKDSIFELKGVPAVIINKKFLEVAETKSNKFKVKIVNILDVTENDHITINLEDNLSESQKDFIGNNFLIEKEKENNDISNASFVRLGVKDDRD